MVSLINPILSALQSADNIRTGEYTVPASSQDP